MKKKIWKGDIQPQILDLGLVDSNVEPEPQFTILLITLTLTWERETEECTARQRSIWTRWNGFIESSLN